MIRGQEMLVKWLEIPK